MPEIPVFANYYDVGIYLLPPIHKNAELALPNKLFEFMQARLGVVVGPSPEMSRVILEWEAGAVCHDFSPRALADELSGLDADAIWRYKQAADAAARVVNAEANADLVRRVVREAADVGP
jgi:hypothetical protein